MPPTHEQMVAAVESYIEGFAKLDANALAGLFAANATVEDPIGTPTIRGIPAIRAFYDQCVSLRPTLTLQGPVRTAGNTAAFAFSAQMPHAGATRRIDVVDIFIFDPNSKIIEMRAIWGPQNVHEI